MAHRWLSSQFLCENDYKKMIGRFVSVQPVSLRTPSVLLPWRVDAVRAAFTRSFTLLSRRFVATSTRDVIENISVHDQGLNSYVDCG